MGKQAGSNGLVGVFPSLSFSLHCHVVMDGLYTQGEC